MGEQKEQMKWRKKEEMRQRSGGGIVQKGGEGTLRFKLLRRVRLCDFTWEIIIEEDDTMEKDPAASL